MKLLKAAGIVAGSITAVAVTAGAVAFAKERIDESSVSDDKAKPIENMGTYERFVKRPLDCALATGATICLSPVLAATALLVRNKLGSPVLFTQERPGRGEKIFKLYKFRTMTDERGDDGELLPDEVRLTKFGKILRSTSLDELPELVNIVRGEMSLIGPRPLMVRYLPLYNDFQKKRHNVRPGLTGLAQVNGRNSLTWEERFELDVEYAENISFLSDAKIILKTITTVLRRDGISSETSETMEDFKGSNNGNE